MRDRLFTLPSPLWSLGLCTLGRSLECSPSKTRYHAEIVKAYNMTEESAAKGAPSIYGRNWRPGKRTAKGKVLNLS